MSDYRPPAERYILFTRDGCPYCVKAKASLDRAGIKYEINNIPEQADRNRFYADFGLKGNEATMPQLFAVVDGREIRIGDSNAIDRFIEELQHI